MSEEQKFVGLETIELNPSILPLVITVDGNTLTEKYKNRLIHNFVWDLTGIDLAADGLPYIEVLPLGQNESVKVYNKDFYKSPDGIKFSYIKIPSGSQGLFTYYYGIQNDAYDNNPVAKKWAGIDEKVSKNEPQTIVLAQEYLEVISIRLEPEVDDCYAYLEGVKIEFSDKNPRVYYYPDIFAGDLILSHGLKAYIYGIRYDKMSEGE